MSNKYSGSKEAEHAFFHSLLIELASKPAGEDIAALLMKSIKEHTNASIAMLSLYDSHRKTLKLFHFEANSNILTTLKQIFGEDIFHSEMFVTDALHKFVLKNYVLRVDKLSTITNGATPAILDQAVKNTMGISCFYGISHVFYNKLFGTTVLAFHKNEPEPSQPFLESFAHLAAVSLRRNIAEKRLKVLLKENQKVIQELEQLNYWKMEEKEKERASIVNILREETGQTLAALKLDTGWLLENLNNDLACREKLQRMTEKIDTSIRFISNLTSELHPCVLNYMGIRSAIEWIARVFEKNTGIRIDLEIDVAELDSALEKACFRIIEEALNNTSKHAKASNVEIFLKQHNNHISLSIKDNGIGISAKALNIRESLGIVEMRQRAKMLGGELTVSADNGTVVSASFPISVAGSQAAAINKQIYQAARPNNPN